MPIREVTQRHGPEGERAPDCPASRGADPARRRSVATRRYAERQVGSAIRGWHRVETPLGPRLRSSVWSTPVDRAGMLLLEIARTDVSIDVTVVPSGRSLTDIEQFHRTAHLDFPASARSPHVFEIDLEPLLRGTWRDDDTLQATHFQIEISANLPDDAIRRVEIHSGDERYQGAGGRAIAGVGGSLRPSFYVRSGVAWVVPVKGSSHPRKLVFHLHGPIGKPKLSARFADLALHPTPLAVLSWGWSRHELELPPGPDAELRFDVGGTGVVLIGDPTIWEPPAKQNPPDVIVYMIDTLLASGLGALGNEVPGVSPVMDAIVNDGLTFVRATSTSAWTKPAIASLMTGVHPLTHRIGTRNYTDRVPHSVPLLQERFRRAGFRTLSASASPLGSTLSGLERGFDLAHPPARWQDALGPLGHPEARQIQAALLSFVDEDPSHPVFAYLHTLEPHEHGRPMFARGASGETPYDRAIRRQDAALGELLSEYRSRGREMILVLLSDHGEGFGEYGIHAGHGYSLRQNQLHVPLVFYGPEWLPQGRVVEPASLVDVAPTLLDLFSLPGLPHAQGRSLLPGRENAPAATFAERTWFLWDHEGPPLLARLGSDGQKLVTGHPQPLFWSLADNPCEDVAHAKKVDEQAALDLLRFEREQETAAARWEAEYGESVAEKLLSDDVARLRALGYLE